MFSYDKGLSSQSLLIWIPDATQFDGRGRTGLTAAGVNLRYKRGARGAEVTVTLSALGSATAAYAANGFIEVDPVNWRGWYRWDPPNALFGAPGDDVSDVFVQISATGAADTPVKITLTEPLYVAQGAADSHIRYVAGEAVAGAGTSGDPWGPAA